MVREHLARLALFAGSLGMILSGCSGSEDAAGGTGGSAGGLSASGGVTTSGVGGVTTSGVGGVTTSGVGGVTTSGPTTTSPAGGTATAATGGASTTGTSSSVPVAGGGSFTGTCTASEAVNARVSGSGPHKVTVETNSDAGIKEGTIYRPTDLGGAEKYPIFVWGNGGCSQDGLSNSAAMAEIASHGYFVIADGTPNSKLPNRGMDMGNPPKMGRFLLNYVDWAIAENGKPCSAYYQSLDTTKIAANGFSCGGLMAEGTAGDPRITTWGVTSSGLSADNDAFYATIHTPALYVEGGPKEVAYNNGVRDFDSVSERGFPMLFFSKRDFDHGGDLWSPNGGHFTKINLAWINWWLKGDETATGKGLLVGPSCPYCTDSAWEYKTKNLQ